MKNNLNSFQVQHKVCDHKVVCWWSNSQRLWHWSHQWRSSYSWSRLLICNVAVSYIFILSDYMLFGTNLCFLSIWPILPDFLALFVQLCRPGSGKGKYCFQIANSPFWRIKNSSILSPANSIENFVCFHFHSLTDQKWYWRYLNMLLSSIFRIYLNNAEIMKQSHHKRIASFDLLFVVEEETAGQCTNQLFWPAGSSWKG